MKVTIQLGLSEIFAALVHVGADEGERALVAFTRGGKIVRLSFGESFMEDAIGRWLSETQGYAVMGDAKWDRHGLSIMVEKMEGVETVVAAAPSAAAPEAPPAPKSTKVEGALEVTIPADPALVGKGEAEMRGQAMNMAKREMQDDLPPALKQIMAAANEEAGLPPDADGELPDGSYANYPGPVGRPVVLKREDAE